MTEFEGLLIDNLRKLNAHMASITERLDEIAANSNYTEDIYGALHLIAENSNDQKNVVDNLQDIASKLDAIGIRLM